MEEHEHGTNPEETPASSEPPKEPPMTSSSTPPPAAAPPTGSAGSQETSTNMDPNLAALLAYLFGWIGGLIFYLIETKNKYVRFHALQSIFLSIAYIVVFVGLSVVIGILAAVPGLGLLVGLLGLLVNLVVGLGGFVLWIILMIKAYQGEKWKLPIIGDMAEKNA